MPLPTHRHLRRPAHRHRCALAFCALALAAVTTGCSRRDRPDRTETFDARAQWAVDAFDVPVLTQVQLAAMLDAGDRTEVLLVDTRTEEEYRVSHLPDAVLWADFADGDPPDRVLEHGRTGQPVVFYCSIGYRSGMAASRVAQLAEPQWQLFNLKGGIFQWANENRPLEGRPLVHGFNHEWSQLLRSDLRAPIQ